MAPEEYQPAIYQRHTIPVKRTVPSEKSGEGKQVKELIMSCAEELFLRFGLRSVSIDDICNRIRISKKTFYQHFPQKETLISDILGNSDRRHVQKVFHSILNQRIRTTDGRTPNVIDYLSGIDRIANFSDPVLIESTRLCNNFQYDLRKYYADIHEEHLKRLHDLTKHQISHIIDRGIRESVFRDDFDRCTMTDILACQCMSSLHHIFEAYHKPVQQKMALNLFASSIIRMLCNQQGLEYYGQIQPRFNPADNSDISK